MSDVLLVTEHFPPGIGGSAVLFDAIYSRLAGRRVTVLTDVRQVPAAVRPDAALRVEHAPLASRDWGVRHMAALGHHLAVARRIVRLSRRGAVVHCGRALPEGVAALAARLAGGPPYVCWVHGEDLSTAATSREQALLTRAVLRWSACTIANSRHTASMALDAGARPGRLKVVYPGVDADRFHPAVDGRPLRQDLAAADEFVLLSVGRLQRRKGHDLVIAALASLRAAAARFRYVIVGDGEERGRLEQLAASHGLAGRVRFVGAVADALLPQYYAAADLFVMPNRIDQHDIEGFGIVFLEAAASGRPAIGGRSGGVPEAVLDGVTGTLVSGTDPRELADAIVRLADSAGLRCRLGTQARARVLAEFAWTRAATKVGEIQDAVASAAGG